MRVKWAVGEGRSNPEPGPAAAPAAGGSAFLVTLLSHTPAGVSIFRDPASSRVCWICYSHKSSTRNLEKQQAVRIWRCKARSAQGCKLECCQHNQHASLLKKNEGVHGSLSWCHCIKWPLFSNFTIHSYELSIKNIGSQASKIT